MCVYTPSAFAFCTKVWTAFWWWWLWGKREKKKKKKNERVSKATFANVRARKLILSRGRLRPAGPLGLGPLTLILSKVIVALSLFKGTCAGCATLSPLPPSCSLRFEGCVVQICVESSNLRKGYKFQ